MLLEKLYEVTQKHICEFVPVNMTDEFRDDVVAILSVEVVDRTVFPVSVLAVEAVVDLAVPACVEVCVIIDPLVWS